MYCFVDVNDNTDNDCTERRNEIFHNLLTAPGIVSNVYVEAARAQPCANHVQHIEHLSRSTCCVPRGTRGSSTIKFDTVEIAFILSLFYSLKPLTDGGGRKSERKPEYPERTPYDKLQKMPHTEKPEMQAPTETRTRTGGRLGKQTC